MTSAREQVKQLQETMNESVLGQGEAVKMIIVGMLCNGNVLLEGYPGTAKTRAIKMLANALSVQMGRIQFTPDLLPSDVTGTEIFHTEGSTEKLVFQPGPLFANLVLADEINRAPAKVQSALLEAMEERQVTVAGKTYPLPELFMVLATQNPIEQEGTYPLPEAQLDRFLLLINIDYPDDAVEGDIIRLVRSEENRPSASDEATIQQFDPECIFTARREIGDIHVSEHVENYMVSLVLATRHPDRYSDSDLAEWIAIGSSPRASISLDKASRAHAWLQGRDFVDPDDVRAVANAVLSHRIILSYEAEAAGVSPSQVVAEMIRQVAVA